MVRISPLQIKRPGVWIGFFSGVFLFIFLIVGICTSCDRGIKVQGTPLNDLGSNELEIYTSEEGIYDLTSSELDKVFPTWETDPTRLHLYLRGQEQQLWVEKQTGSYHLYFYGQGSDSLYTTDNVYWLKLDHNNANVDKKPYSRGNVGVKQQPTLASGVMPESYFLGTIHNEENHIYAPQVKEGDHWFWAVLPAPKQQTFEIQLLKTAPGRGHIRVAVWSSTEAPISPDHHIRITINGQINNDETWDGLGRHTLEADIPTGILIEGVNRVGVEAPGDTGAGADINYIDWIEIQYPRYSKADQDYLKIDKPSAPLRLTGFTQPITIFDITNPSEVTRIIGISQDGKEPLFQGESDHHYLVVGSQGYHRPVKVIPPTVDPDLRAPGIGADYIAVGPPDLLEPLKPLLDWRTSSGLKTRAIPIEAVYDQFNYGFPEPEAIQNFLEFAVQSWKPSPRFLLLVGDSTYDPRGYISTPESNRLPTIFIQTEFGGETASDVLYAQLDKGNRPSLAVGRMPASKPGQIRILVEKIINYEQQTPGEAWTQRVLAIADGQDQTFRNDAQAFLDQFPNNMQTDLYAPEAGAQDGSVKIPSYFDKGYFLITYFGHGSVNMWGKDRLFNTEDIPKLKNTELPIIINMSCLTGLFTHPKVESIAESLLWQPKAGAVAVLAPTSLTLPSDQSYLSNLFVEAYLQNPKSTLGEMLLQAQRQIPLDNTGTREVMQTFLLFGDPGLRIVQARP